MIDTIAITLTRRDFGIFKHDKFTPSTLGLFEPPYYKMGGRATFSCYQNPTKAQILDDGYMPRLTATKRMRNGGFFVTLKIEFSAPKLLRGNNFDELTDYDFDDMISTLLVKLKNMGVDTDYERLADAQVSAIHYSKNIALTDHSSSSMIISEVAKQDLNAMLDLTKTDYRNGGHSVRCHANSYEIIFYDKIKDLQQGKKSDKKAIENDAHVQLDMLDALTETKPLEIIRMEARLGNRTKIKSMLRKINESEKMTLGLLFNEEVAQKMLLHFWEKINDGLYLSSLSQQGIDRLAYMLAGKVKPAKMLQIIGGVALIEKVGVRGLQSIIQSNANARTWQRIKKELLEAEISANDNFRAIKNIDDGLNDFIPLRVGDYTQAIKNLGVMLQSRGVSEAHEYIMQQKTEFVKRGIEK